MAVKKWCFINTHPARARPNRNQILWCAAPGAVPRCVWSNRFASREPAAAAAAAVCVRGRTMTKRIKINCERKRQLLTLTFSLHLLGSSGAGWCSVAGGEKSLSLSLKRIVHRALMLIAHRMHTHTARRLEVSNRL